MVITRAIPAFLAAALFALTGCELIGGLEQRTLEPSDAGASNDGSNQDVVTDDASDAADAQPDVPLTCNLPASAEASLRVGNLMPAYTRVDFCFKTSDQAWSDVKPVLAGGGGACQRGLGYRDITTTFGIPSGAYDIIAIEDKGGATPPKCSDKAISTASQVVINEGDIWGALLFGDSTSTAVLRAWPESRASGTIASDLRFLNALVGSDKLDCGVADANTLPATISASAFTKVPFATLPAPGSSDSGVIDSNGYVSLQIPGGDIAFAVANAGTPDAMLVNSQAFQIGGSYTAFAAGRLGDKLFPSEMFFCDDTKADGILERCGNTPVTLTVDSANVQLAGAWGPYDKERTQPIEDAIAQLPSDVVCVHEAWGKSNKDGITKAAQSKFQYQAVFFTDLNTPVDDATDQNGDVPPEPTVAPCANSDAKFQAAMDCIRDNCSDPANESGVPKAFFSTCVTQKCSLKMLPLLSSIATADDKACYSCMFVHLAGWESIADIRTQCSTVPKARFADGGDVATILLSKYPIDNATSWLIGSTEWRVNIIRAPITLSNNAQVDVYCTQLTTPGSGMTRPYTGYYGGGKSTSDEQWQQELYLQAHKLVSYVQAQSVPTKRKAVIVGTIYSGPAVATSNLSEVNVEAYNTISGAFPPAWPQDYTPSCTLCNDNTLLHPPPATSTSESWQSFVFLSNIAATDVKSDSTFWKDQVVDVPKSATDPTTYKVPLSTHYGFRSVIKILR